MANNYMDKLAPKLDYVDSLQDAFRLFEKVIYKNLHVATLAIYKNITTAYSSYTGYGVAEVAPIPVEKNRGEYKINAYFLDDYGFEENELVAVIYTDLNFLDNLNNNRKEQKASTDKVPHSQMNAVIIPATKNGPQGKSAYQVAVDNGFSGTEQEWLDSLVGPQGPAGADGQTPKFYKHFVKLVGSYQSTHDIEIYLDVITLTSGSSTGYYWDDINFLYEGKTFKINGYYNNNEYELLEYLTSSAKMYLKTKDYGTNNCIQFNINNFEIISDVVSEIK